MQVRAFSCRRNTFAILPLDNITHGSFVRKQVVATSMCCYLSSALPNGIICSHVLMILLSISVRLFAVNRTVLSCPLDDLCSCLSSYVVTTHIMNGGWTTD